MRLDYEDELFTRLSHFSSCRHKRVSSSEFVGILKVENKHNRRNISMQKIDN